MFPVWSDWDISYTTKGLWKRRLGGVVKVVAFAALIAAAKNVATKPELWSVQYGVSLARSGFQSILQRGISTLAKIQARYD